MHTQVTPTVPAYLTRKLSYKQHSLAMEKIIATAMVLSSLLFGGR